MREMSHYYCNNVIYAICLHLPSGCHVCHRKNQVSHSVVAKTCAPQIYRHISQSLKKFSCSLRRTKNDECNSESIRALISRAGQVGARGLSHTRSWKERILAMICCDSIHLPRQRGIFPDTQGKQESEAGRRQRERNGQAISGVDEKNLFQEIKETAQQVVDNIKETVGLKEDEEHPAKAAFEHISRASQAAGQSIRQTMEQAGERLPRYSFEARGKQRPNTEETKKNTAETSIRADPSSPGGDDANSVTSESPRGGVSQGADFVKGEEAKQETESANAKPQPVQDKRDMYGTEHRNEYKAGDGMGLKEEKRLQEDNCEFRGQRSRL
jgi:hypothetical protein